MAAPTLAQYQDRNFPRLSQELILDLTRSSPIMRVLPMIAVDASGAQWNPVNALGGVARTTGAYTTVAAGAQTATTTTKKNRTLVTWYGDVHMDQIQANNMREVSNQIVGKSVAIGRDFNEQFIEGDGSANNMTGLDSDESIPVGQQIGSAGTLKTFDLPMMDALARRINGRMDAYILHSDHISTLEEKLRQANGASLMGIREMPDPTNGSDETVEFQTYRGKLLIYNDHIAKTTVGARSPRPSMLCASIPAG